MPAVGGPLQTGPRGADRGVTEAQPRAFPSCRGVGRVNPDMEGVTEDRKSVV